MSYVAIVFPPGQVSDSFSGHSESGDSLAEFAERIDVDSYDSTDSLCQCRFGQIDRCALRIFPGPSPIKRSGLRA